MGIRVKLPATECKNNLIIFILSLIFCFGHCNEGLAAPSYMSFRDHTNRTINLFHPAVRIISLSQAHTENLVAIRAVKQITGVSYLTSSKWILKNIRRLSRVPSAEQISELKPDIVILDSESLNDNISLIKDLDKEKIPYIVMDRPENIGLKRYMDILGGISGRTAEAKKALVFYERCIYKAAVRSANARRPNVFVIAGSDFSTCAYDSWGAKLIAFSGGKLISDKNAARINGYPWFIFYGPNRLAAAGNKVDVIITLSENERRISSITRETILKDPRFKDIPAVKNGMVWEMNEDDLMLPSMLRLDSSLVRIWKLFNAGVLK